MGSRSEKVARNFTLTAVGLLALTCSSTAQDAPWAVAAADALWAAIPPAQRAFLQQHKPEAIQWLRDQDFLRILARQEITLSNTFLTQVFRRNARDADLRQQTVEVHADGTTVLGGYKKVFFGLIKARFFFELTLEGYSFSKDRRVFRFRLVKSKPADYDPNQDGTFRQSPFLSYDASNRRLIVDLDKLREADDWFGRGWISLIRIQSVRFLDGVVRVRFDLRRVDEQLGISSALAALAGSLASDGETSPSRKEK